MTVLVAESISVNPELSKQALGYIYILMQLSIGNGT